MTPLPNNHVLHDGQTNGVVHSPALKAHHLTGQPHKAEADILRVENLTVIFSGLKPLTDLTFSVRRGELRVVIGPNGAGKPTLLDVITGKPRPRPGRVLFQSQEVTRLSAERIA